MDYGPVVRIASKRTMDRLTWLSLTTGHRLAIRHITFNRRPVYRVTLYQTGRFSLCAIWTDLYMTHREAIMDAVHMSMMASCYPDRFNNICGGAYGKTRRKTARTKTRKTSGDEHNGR